MTRSRAVLISMLVVAIVLCGSAFAGKPGTHSESILLSDTTTQQKANKVTGDFVRVSVNNLDALWAQFVSAHEAVEMENGKIRPAKGMVTTHRIDDPGRYWMADILCVNVADESNAFIAGVIEASTTSLAVGSYVKLWFVDGGEPGSWADALWSNGRIQNEGDATVICSDPWNNLPTREFYVIDGNIQIHYDE